MSLKSQQTHDENDYCSCSTGGVLQCEEGQSPLQPLEEAAVHLASAIRLSGTDARLHFLLGVVLEEQHRAAIMYRLPKKVGGATESDQPVFSCSSPPNTHTHTHTVLCCLRRLTKAKRR